MANEKRNPNKCGFNVHTPNVGLYPAGSIKGVSGGKVITSGAKKKPKK